MPLKPWPSDCDTVFRAYLSFPGLPLTFDGRAIFLSASTVRWITKPRRDLYTMKNVTRRALFPDLVVVTVIGSALMGTFCWYLVRLIEILGASGAWTGNA